jgi:hypothetical protein
LRMAKNTKKSSMISVRELANKANVDYPKLYNNLNGTYSSLTHQEKTQLVNAFYDEMSTLLQKLGFYMKIRPLKDQGQTHQ